MRARRARALLTLASLAMSARAFATPRFVSRDAAVLAPLARPDGIGAGVSLGDIDGDGDDDVFFVRPRDGITVLRSEPAGLAVRDAAPIPRGANPSWHAFGIAAGDIDGDGHVDLVAGGDGAYFWRGRGDGTFVDHSPVAFDGAWQDVSGISLADVDGDGLLDVYLTGYVRGTDWPHVRCDRDALYLQRAFGAWVSVPLPDAATNAAGCGFGALLFDIDRDGDTDALVANDFGPGEVPWHVWRQDGIDNDGALALHSGPDVTARPVRSYGMGAALGDLDGDGVLDVATTSIGRAPFLHGVGDGTFIDAADAWGLGSAFGREGLRVTWGAWINDIDGDGSTDVLLSGGYVPGDPGLGAVANGSVTLFLDGARRPAHASPSALDPTLPDGVEYRAFATGDVNADGAPDLVFTTALGGVPALLRNALTDAPWIAVRPRGTVSPREPRGAIVTLHCAGAPARVSVVPTGGNAASLGAPRAFVSRANCASPDLTIDWPSGVRSHLDLPAGSAATTLDAVEPRWLTVTHDVLIVAGDATLDHAGIDLAPLDARGDPLGPAHDVRVELLAGAATVDPVGDHGDGHYGTVVHASSPGEIWLRIVIDGRVMPRRIHLPVLAATGTTLIAAAPVTVSPTLGTTVAIVPRHADGTLFGPGVDFPVNIVGGTQSSAREDLGDGTYVLHVMATGPAGSVVTIGAVLPDGSAAQRVLTVANDVDPVRSRIEFRSAYVGLGNPLPTMLDAEPLLSDTQGRPIPVAGHTLTVERADGTALAPQVVGDPGREQFMLAGFTSADEPWTVRIDGIPLAQHLTLHTGATPTSLRNAIDGARSRIRPLQDSVRADGVDTTRIVWLPRDAEGQGVPFADLQWDVSGGTVNASNVVTMANGAYGFPFVAGSSPGVAVVRATARDGLTFQTSIALLPPLDTVLDHIDFCVTGAAIPGATAALLFVRITPRDADGLLIGGHRDLTASSDDGAVTLTLEAGAYTGGIAAPATRPSTTITVVDRGTIVPANATPALHGTLTVPSAQLVAETSGPDNWLGDERCFTIRADGTAPDGGAQDAAVAMDGGGADATRDEAPHITVGGGCGCRVPVQPLADRRAGWLALVVCALAGRRRTERPTVIPH